MSYCAADCPGAGTLVGNPTASCTENYRNKTISRLLFFDCGTDLPSPLTCESMDTLFTSRAIVASSELANVVVNDPTTEDVVISDCRPPRKKVVARNITWEDRFAIALSTGSPAVVNQYFDYDFWKDKKNARLRLRYGIVFCDGDVIICRDSKGQPLSAEFDVFLSYQKSSTPGGQSVEFKKGSIDFAGDPLDFAKPDFNINDCGIVL
jgi:hypothetical protein